MTKLTWGKGGERLYEAGVDRGVFYPPLGPGIVWNGLIAVRESTENKESLIVYIDGQRKTTEISLGTFAAELEAYTYPPEFEDYDGLSKWDLTAQTRPPFNFSYRTLIGDDQVGISKGYKIHLVYNALTSPVEQIHETLNPTVSIENFKWNLSTIPVEIPGYRPSSHFVVDSTKVYPETLTLIEDMLYGTDLTDSHFPTIEELLEIFESTAIFKVTDNGDGTATIEGPDDIVFMVDEIEQIAQFGPWPSVVELSEDTYQLSSL